ncbi:unnamed protein product [Citrullus colocynthis]|uniref:Uncharacterized protein n=1 Tax=Citrullus colocynthis TaxID=252529 RepID=A0ABP0Y4D1_9ROSI
MEMTQLVESHRRAERIVDPAVAVIANSNNPVAKMANENDQASRTLSTSENRGTPNGEVANGDDSVGKISSAQENIVDPNVAMANSNNLVAGIPLAPKNRVDPDAVSYPLPDFLPFLGVKIEVTGEEMPADMREYITERMGGYRVQMIIEKTLTSTDMRKDQGRLSLPTKKFKARFLTTKEEGYFMDRSELNNGLNYIDTIIMGSNLRENPMQFKKWLLGARFVDFFIKKLELFFQNLWTQS